MSETATGALAGLRVLELGTLIAGPFCGQLMGDMGAEVIKLKRQRLAIRCAIGAEALRCGGL